MKKYNFKEFGLSSWAIDNRATVFLMTIFIVIVGIWSYIKLPKEQFPEIQVPQIYVYTVYPGTAPKDMETLITRKIEKELKSIDGVKEIKSNSVQDYSAIIIQFETNVDVDEAKQEVKDAVDRSKSELPTDLPSDPAVMEINFSEIPIMFLNVSGKLDDAELKSYAEDIKDQIEAFSEIDRVDIVGAAEQEMQVNVDLYAMQEAGVTFNDIERAIASENVIISGGSIKEGTKEVAISVNGEFGSAEDIRNLMVSGVRGGRVFLGDIAEVKDTYKDKESYARYFGQNVITLNVIKKAGENLIDASDKIRVLIDELKEKPKYRNVEMTITQDQSNHTRNTLEELINTIIIGFILVTLVLMFFMGLRDAMFVGLSVPLSSFIAFIILPMFGFTMNLVVLFTFILALGIVVDNAIVVIENTYRIFTQEKLPIVTAAKKAAGEVIAPVFAGTLTTMAPFVPLLFWEGMVGEFMFFLPVTILITLGASLLVAYVINPVFAAQFMKRPVIQGQHKPFKKGNLVIVGFIVLLAILLYLNITSLFLPIGSGASIEVDVSPGLSSKTSTIIGSLLLFGVLFWALYETVISKMIRGFQEKILPAMINRYRRLLEWALEGSRPVWILISLPVLLIISVILLGMRSPNIDQFPSSDPNQVFIYNTFPIGTRVEYTDSVTKIIEGKVFEILGDSNPNVKSVITNVALGATDPMEGDRSVKAHRSKISIEFVQFKFRTPGTNTWDILDTIRTSLQGMEGVQISVEKEANGPPQPKPVSLEVSGEDVDSLIVFASLFRNYLKEKKIDGVEELKWDLELGKPEKSVIVDIEKANRMGISTAQIGMLLRTAIFGKEASKFRSNEDEYEIMIRANEDFRNDVEKLMEARLIYRDMSTGMIYEVPVSSVARVKEESSFGGINRKDLKKMVTIYSNLLTGYNPQEVNAEIAVEIENFKETFENRLLLNPDIEINISGALEEQEETAAFLGTALLASVFLILVILMTQFNSLAKVGIILSQILFSIIGIFLGLAFTGMDVSIVMTGVGVVALAGIVVNNGILLIDFTDQLVKQKSNFKKAVIEGGAVRFTPVLLTASSTILGLVPLAVAMNMDFASLLSSGDPKLFFGGDNAAFWGPLSWTIIFGLTFATIVTLVAVPVMYYLSHTWGIALWRTRNRLVKKLFS